MSWENKPPPAIVMKKQIDRLDDGCRAVLANSPIAGFGHLNADGSRAATFVGGAAGFVRVHSPRRFSFPFETPVAGGVSFVFLLPGIGETLRLNGDVAEHRAGMLTVEVREAYVHCARCVLRSRLWQPVVPRRTVADPDPVREFLATTPFLVLSTGDAAGGGDTSPRGDEPGFVQVLADGLLAIPDRRGNQRADTFRNLIEDDRIALAALRPGRAEVLHLRGTATITDDPDLLATMALRGVVPQAALLIKVADAAVVGNQAVAGARIWNPARHVDRAAVPDLMTLAVKHAATNPTLGFLRPLARFPRLIRLLINLGYRSQLRKEGYPASAGNATREMRITEVRRETPDAVTLVLRDAADPDRPIPFRPGQFFTLIAEIGGREVRRAYSASSAPGSPGLEITVKRVGGGVFSTHAHRHLRPGDRLAVRGPSGTLRADGPELVMVAAGSGITPMMSIIRTRLADDPPPRLALLYGNRDESSTLFAAELDRFDQLGRLSVTHRRSGDRGRIDAAAVRQWLDRIGPTDAARYLLCGPEPLMDTVRGVLADRGVPADRVHQESYRSAADEPGTAAGEPQSLTVEQDGDPVATVVVEPGQTLLTAALAAGAPMPYSCTVGNCGECMVRLRTGTVTMSEPNCLTEPERAAGQVLTCVARPQSAVTIDIPLP